MVSKSQNAEPAYCVITKLLWKVLFYNFGLSYIWKPIRYCWYLQPCSSSSLLNFLCFRWRGRGSMQPIGQFNKLYRFRSLKPKCCQGIRKSGRNSKALKYWVLGSNVMYSYCPASIWLLHINSKPSKTRNMSKLNHFFII